MFEASSWHIKGVMLLLIVFFLAMNCSAMDAPEIIEIDALADLYESVEFNHELHVGVAEDCSGCHHHTTGTGTVDTYCAKCHDNFEEQDTVACHDCHLADPFSAEAINKKSEKDHYHVDVNGLKGAYHQNCLGCHQEMDGPSGCQDCHARTEVGDAFYHSGKFAPKPDEQTVSH